MIHADSRVEDIPEQPIKPLLMVSKNICSRSKPISRLSEAEITGALAVQDKLANSETQAILFYIKEAKSNTNSGPLSLRGLMCGYPQESAAASKSLPGTEEIRTELMNE